MFCETILFMWAPLSLNNTLPFMILIIKHLSDSIRPSVHLFRHRLRGGAEEISHGPGRFGLAASSSSSGYHQPSRVSFCVIDK